MRRFYTTAAAQQAADGWLVALDGKPLRTPAGRTLVVPTQVMADSIAAEWSRVDREVRPAELRLTGLANAAVDHVAPDPLTFARGLASYGESDLLCYRADAPTPLVDRQRAAWDPLLEWAGARYDVAFTLTSGLIHRPQPTQTVERLRAAVEALDPLRLAALSPLVTISGSLVIALAVLEGRLDAEGAWAAGQLDELWQAEQWGEDELAAASRADRRATLDAAVQMLRLLAG